MTDDDVRPDPAEIPELPELAGSTWYHGSPERLTVLRVGSVITVYREIARVFSHKPPLVSVDWPDDVATWRSAGPMSIRHNGTTPGYLYRIAERLGAGDLRRHPAAETGSPDEDWEWLVTREIRLELIGRTEPRPDELLTAAEISRLRPAPTLPTDL